MTPEEIPQLLQQLSYADPRILPDDPDERRGKVAMWAAVLADVPYDFAMRTAVAHYRKSPFPIAPSEIAAPWVVESRARLGRHTDPTPQADPDDEAAYRAELLGTRRAVAGGRQEPAHHELAAGPMHPDVAERLKALGSYVPRHVDEVLDAHRPVKAARRAAIQNGQPDALSVPCGWCDAPVGEPCRFRRIPPRSGATSTRRRDTPHPSRLDDARDAMNTQETQA